MNTCPSREIEIGTDVSRRHRARVLGRFLKGPILLQDIGVAAKLPGQALALYLAIRHRSDLTRSAEVSIPASLLGLLGICKDSKSRGLKCLSSAGLIVVRQQRGRSARIALVRAGSTPTQASL
jgi:hypothetical protein